ncbi:hypothetical protein EDD17DRAFT_1508116 [Pisolithus thermaeus]|nr:hypothetical protein EDD17DRAFT_1508116 [Pisolithus thermaeus]
MDSQPKDSYRYPTNTDARQPMDDAGEELVEGPDGYFDARRREWTQVGKKEKPSIMHEICKEFVKMEKHCNLMLVEWQEKEEQITTWLKKPIRKTSLMSSSRQPRILRKNGMYWRDQSKRNAKKYGLKYMQNFVEEMWQYCGMRIISLTGWKNEEGIIQACCMDFNNDIGGSHMFDNIHTISASWREYLGNAYKNPDIAAGEEVQNMGYLTVHYHEPQSDAHFSSNGVAQLLERMPGTHHEAWESCLALVRWVVVFAFGYQMVPGSCDLVE